MQEFKAYMKDTFDFDLQSLIYACDALSALGDGSIASITEWFLKEVTEFHERERAANEKEPKNGFEIEVCLRLLALIYLESNWCLEENELIL